MKRNQIIIVFFQLFFQREGLFLFRDRFRYFFGWAVAIILVPLQEIRYITLIRSECSMAFARKNPPSGGNFGARQTCTGWPEPSSRGGSNWTGFPA